MMYRFRVRLCVPIVRTATTAAPNIGIPTHLDAGVVANVDDLRAPSPNDSGLAVAGGVEGPKILT